MNRPPAHTHAFLDARSLALHQRIAEKLREHPALLQVAQDNLDRWRSTLDPRSRPAMDEWQAVLQRGLESTVALMLDESERGIQLRQSAPFAGVLSHQERWAFFEQWKRENGRAS